MFVPVSFASGSRDRDKKPSIAAPKIGKFLSRLHVQEFDDARHMLLPRRYEKRPSIEPYEHEETPDRNGRVKNDWHKDFLCPLQYSHNCLMITYPLNQSDVRYEVVRAAK